MPNVDHGNRQQSGAPFVNNRNVQAAATFAAAAGASNITEVTINFQDGAGVNIAEATVFTVWLSDAASGAGLTATAASGTVTVKSASGAVMGTLTAKKALVVQSLATGAFILQITDTAKTAFLVCVQNPSTGEVHVSDALETGDYG